MVVKNADSRAHPRPKTQNQNLLFNKVLWRFICRRNLKSTKILDVVCKIVIRGKAALKSPGVKIQVVQVSHHRYMESDFPRAKNPVIAIFPTDAIWIGFFIKYSVGSSIRI